MIKLENVNKSYYLGDEEVKAVRGVSLTIKEKEFIGILGTSGSGKSTLMHLIGLLDKPTKGQILIQLDNMHALAQLQGAEAHVDEEVVRLIDGARHHSIDGAILQAIAGQLDGVKG